MTTKRPGYFLSKRKYNRPKFHGPAEQKDATVTTRAVMERYIRKSRFLSWALRHDPAKIGLELHRGGWADIGHLVECARNNRVSIDRNTIYDIVESDTKGRYEISADLKRIRAVYGHSVSIELDLVPSKPPDTLYHGTSTKTVESIMKNGIMPGRRRYVHLSLSRETAGNVGSRHGTPAILSIDAGRMHEEGLHLYGMTGDIWLTEAVPPCYILTGRDDYACRS